MVGGSECLSTAQAAPVGLLPRVLPHIYRNNFLSSGSHSSEHLGHLLCRRTCCDHVQQCIEVKAKKGYCQHVVNVVPVGSVISSTIRHATQLLESAVRREQVLSASFYLASVNVIDARTLKEKLTIKQSFKTLYSYPPSISTCTR